MNGVAIALCWLSIDADTTTGMEIHRFPPIAYAEMQRACWCAVYKHASKEMDKAVCAHRYRYWDEIAEESHYRMEAWTRLCNAWQSEVPDRRDAMRALRFWIGDEAFAAGQMP